MFAWLAMTAVAHKPPHAKTARPQPSIAPLLAQLAQTPDDLALRTKIIHIVLAMPHPPAIPDAVNEQIGAAVYAFKNAQSTADFQSAADAFAKASVLAPWVADLYFDLAQADEKTQNFDGAIANLRLYLIARPNASDKNAREQEIGALEYQKQRKAESDAASAQAAAAQQAQQAANQQALTLFGQWTSGISFLADTCNPNSAYQIPNLMATIPAYAKYRKISVTYASESDGCTDNQWNASVWRPTNDSGGGNMPWFVFTISGGQVTLAPSDSPGSTFFVGTPEGADPANISWQCVVPATPTSQPTQEPAWSLLGKPYQYNNNDGKFNLYLSCDRPISGGNGAAVYHYIWIKPPTSSSTKNGGA